MNRAPSMAALCCLLCAALVPPTAPGQVKERKPGGSGTTTYAYQLTDLLGFPSQGYQSRPSYLSNRDQPRPAEDYPGGSVTIYGVSRVFVDGRGEFRPARWTVDNTGAFPTSDPVDSGLPGLTRDVEVRGLSALGFGVVRTIWSGEMDQQGNYVFPSYLDDFGGPFVELADVDGGRDTMVQGANNLGQLVGTGQTGGLMWDVFSSKWPRPSVDLGLFLPQDINDRGIMAGSYGGYMAIAWVSEGQLNLRVLTSTKRSRGATVAAVNDCAIDESQLAIVGTSYENEAEQAEIRGLLWRPNDQANPWTVIGTLGGKESYGLDVNRSGEVVGYSSGSKGGQFATVYKNGTLIDLNRQAALTTQTLNQATAINDSGDIIGFMQYPRPISEQRGFLLRPTVSQ